jgi:hypothetical protein
MPTASVSSAGLFAGLALVVAGLVVYGVRRASVGPVPTLAIVLAYLGIPGLLTWMRALDRYDPLPAPALLVMLGLAILTIAIVFSPIGRRLAVGVSMGAVVALQAFRVPVELLLHRLYLEGAVPIEMTYSGRNLDMLTGISGLLLGVWLMRARSVPRSLVVAWNILGLALLVNIIGIAILSTPVPFRRFVDGPPNLLPSTFPYVWLPSFLVPLALGSHLLVFRQLRLRKGRA